MDNMMTQDIQEVSVGVKYEAQWPIPRLNRRLKTWIPGKSTHELIKNGLDYQVLQTSLEENTIGKTRILNLEDLNEEDVPLVGSPSTSIDLYSYIYHNKISYGMNLFTERGLELVNSSGYPEIIDLEPKIRFIKKDRKTGEKGYAFLEFSKHYLGYRWELMLNSATRPCRFANWDDIQGLSNLAKILETISLRDLEISLALEDAGTSKWRNKTLLHYEENKKYLITEEEKDEIVLVLETYRREFFIPNNKTWELDFSINAIDLGLNYSSYMAGLIVKMKHKNEDAKIITKDYNRIQKELIRSLAVVLSPFNIGIAFGDQERPIGKVIEKAEILVLFTKHPSKIFNNIGEVEKLSRSFTKAIKLFGESTVCLNNQMNYIIPN